MQKHTRRGFLKVLGIGSGAAAVAASVVPERAHATAVPEPTPEPITPAPVEVTPTVVAQDFLDQAQREMADALRAFEPFERRGVRRVPQFCGGQLVGHSEEPVTLAGAADEPGQVTFYVAGEPFVVDVKPGETAAQIEERLSAAVSERLQTFRGLSATISFRLDD